MDRQNVFLIVSVALVLVAAANLIFQLNQTYFTGHATEVGSANLTVESQTNINFSTATINWGSGRVDNEQTYANLTSDGLVHQGNWTNVTAGLVIENLGNLNVSLDLQASANASTFLGGGSPLFQWKISNNESSSCSGGNLNLDQYYDVNVTSQARACGNFSSLTNSNQVEIDIHVSIPEDSAKGARGATITATATAT